MRRNKALIDSHLLIWLLFEPEKVPSRVKEFIDSVDEIYLSIASLWELAIKHAKNKLSYTPQDLLAGANELNLNILPLRAEHLLNLDKIEINNKDPFDKLLLAQAVCDDFALITSDKSILQTTYNTFWS